VRDDFVRPQQDIETRRLQHALDDVSDYFIGDLVDNLPTDVFNGVFGLALRD